MTDLLLGAGQRRERYVHSPAGLIYGEWGELVTLDIDPGVEPDVVWDLDNVPYPFPDNYFEEVHAYEVLEHCGTQGDWRFFFAQFTEFHRILKPGGLFIASVPHWQSIWAWGDPGHRRVITLDTLVFLNQQAYEQSAGTPMTDYRGVYKVNFNILWAGSIGPATDAFVLECA